MKDIDFMARGWWIDPRSSWKMSESIMYDPYNFETSGGTMFFSSSEEANKLIQLWIKTAENPVNDGKADDRVLSLIFNTKAVLTWIRVIQLPIEYLWLTLDYDERMIDEVYDYNISEMDSTIFIDHKECLTSEDTATGAGASSNRQPKFYDFLEDLTPCSETTHEYIMFKDLIQTNPESTNHITTFMALSDNEKTDIENTRNKSILEHKSKLATSSNVSPTGEDKNTLKATIKELKDQKTSILFLPYLFWYYHYMAGITYIDDGNPELQELGLIDQENPEDNTQPLDIVSYKDKFGNKKHPMTDDGESVNEIVDINIKTARQMNLDGLYKDNSEGFILKDMTGFTEIIPTDNTSISYTKLFRVILRFLLDEKTIVFNPTSFENYDISLYNKLTSNLTTLYKNCDFVFHPDHIVTTKRSSFYKPKLSMNQVILFRPDSRLIDFISMNLSLEDLSIFINNGSYEFMSLIRIAFIFKSRPQIGIHDSSITQNGGYKERKLPKYDIYNTINEYIDVFEEPVIIGGNIKKRTRRKNKTNKKLTTNKKLSTNKTNKTNKNFQLTTRK